MLGPHCCVWFFSLVAEQGLLFPVVCGLLTVAASLAGTHRPYSKRAPIVVAFELSGPVACGVFLDQGWSPRSPALAGRFFTTAPLRKSLPLWSLTSVCVMTDEVQYLFMHTWAIWVSFSVKCLLRPFDHLKFWFCLLKLDLWKSFITMGSLDIGIANILSHFIGCLVTLFMVSFDRQKCCNIKGKCFYHFFFCE